MFLSFAALGALPAAIRRPQFARDQLQSGILHLGVGAFHRAHQAVYTDDAIEASGGNWGIIGVSMRKPDIADLLSAQAGLYTVETRQAAPRYRVIGSLLGALTLPREPAAVLARLADPSTQIVTLTITEKGYCLGPDGLDWTHPDIAQDLVDPSSPRSAIGAIIRGLQQRQAKGGAPVTVISCDNLTNNGPRLFAALQAFAARVDPALARWIGQSVACPETMVDSIVPATDSACLSRCAAALGVNDGAAVQREPFAQWVIEDKFITDRPAWDRVGVEIVPAVAPFRQLKLHVLNAAHSALAYLGLARGHEFVRDAVADPSLADFLDRLMRTEVGPGLPDLAVPGYWQATLARFQNPAIDHRLDQIAQDGAFKLAQRIYPLMIENDLAGRPTTACATIVRAWLAFIGIQSPDAVRAALADPMLFPIAFQQRPSLVAAVLASDGAAMPVS